MTLIKNIPANTQTQQPDLQLQSSGCSAQLFKPVLLGISQSKPYKSHALAWCQVPEHEGGPVRLARAEVACLFLPEMGLAELKVTQESAKNGTLINPFQSKISNEIPVRTLFQGEGTCIPVPPALDFMLPKLSLEGVIPTYYNFFPQALNIYVTIILKTLQKHYPHLVPKYVILCFVLLNFLLLKSVQLSVIFFSGYLYPSLCLKHFVSALTHLFLIAKTTFECIKCGLSPHHYFTNLMYCLFSAWLFLLKHSMSPCPLQ